MSYVVLDLPIEPIEGRYSIQWEKWFDEAWARNRIPCAGPTWGWDGSFGSRPEGGKFLDPYNTFEWKFGQLRRVLEKVKQASKTVDRIVVFLHDGWFPGIECFKYIGAMEGIDVRICSYWHAGAYDPTDLLGKKGLFPSMQGSESSWLTMNDAVFVGTNYHREKLLDAHPEVDSKKVIVVGGMVKVSRFDSTKPRKNRVVWPHRISPDKCPEKFDKLKSSPHFRDVEFIRTKDLNLSKQEYYELLTTCKAVVSTAEHENFGISVIEAMCLGCYPVVPDALAYQETVPIRYRYTSEESMQELLRTVLIEPDPYIYPYEERYSPKVVTDSICSVIERIGKEGVL